MPDTDTQASTLCEVCEKEPSLGKLGRFKMKALCIECAAGMRDKGDCPMCRLEGALAEKGSDHMLDCTGRQPRKSKAKKSGRSKKELDMEQERKVHEAQARLDKKRAARDAPVKNVMDMNLDELKDRLDGYWIEVAKVASSKNERIQVKHVDSLEGNVVELTAGNGATRTIDRKNIKKMQRI